MKKKISHFNMTVFWISKINRPVNKKLSSHEMIRLIEWKIKYQLNTIKYKNCESYRFYLSLESDQNLIITNNHFKFKIGCWFRSLGRDRDTKFRKKLDGTVIWTSLCWPHPTWLGTGPRKHHMTVRKTDCYIKISKL